MKDIMRLMRNLGKRDLIVQRWTRGGRMGLRMGAVIRETTTVVSSPYITVMLIQHCLPQCMSHVTEVSFRPALESGVTVESAFI